MCKESFSDIPEIVALDKRIKELEDQLAEASAQRTKAIKEAVERVFAQATPSTPQKGAQQ